MRKITALLLASTLLSFSSPALAGISKHDAKDKMLENLDLIKNAFDVGYAPKEWKKIFAEWELESEIDRAKVQVLETPDITVKDFQRIILGFFNSTQDFHVGVTFYSTEYAFLPFRVQSAEGRYFFAWVDEFFRDILSLPIKKGDEILYFNGQPIDEVVRELRIKEFGDSLSASTQALAESALTARSGMSGNEVPRGPVIVTVKDAVTGKITECEMRWLYEPEEISSSISPMTAGIDNIGFSNERAVHLLVKKHGKRPLGEQAFFHKDMTAPFYRNYKKLTKKRDELIVKQKGSRRSELEDDDDYYIGSKKSFVPQLGTVVWEAPKSSPFHAYIYLDGQGRKVGYIRIPHFSEGSYAAKQFGEIIDVFEQETEALVIDELNNPGGAGFYMYALASMLTDSPLFVFPEKMTITQEDVFFAVNNLYELEEIKDDEGARSAIGSNLAGYPVDFELAQSFIKFYRFVIQQWNEGKHFTNHAFNYGMDYLKPNPNSHYTKPLVVLVNELDFSCGDFFPAILQDNGRAKILGKRTAGAGGFVLHHSYPNLFGIAGFSYTGSIAQRADLNPIENLGVIPDIPVELTSKDLQGGFEDYKCAVQKAVSDLLN